MGFGIGLGAFVDGMSRGYGIRSDMQDREQAQIDRERARARQDKADAWAEEDRTYITAKRDREKRALDSVDQINAETKAQFDDAVKAGTATPDQFDEFWTKHALPMMKNQLLMNGDVGGASALQEWADTEDAKKGAKLFSSALLKAQTGDGGGALDDAMAAGKLKGYLDHGLELSDKEEIKDANGNVVGYRVTLKDGDNLIHQDIALEDIPNVIATFANPESAFQSQQAAKAEQGKRANDLADYKAKKDIDAGAEGDSKYRQKAIEALRKRFEDAHAMDENQPLFDQIVPDEQEQLINDEIALQRGTRQPPAPQPSIVVDTATGQQVPTGLTGAPQAPVNPQFGLGGVPTAQPGGPATAVPAPTAATTAPAQVSGAVMTPEQNRAIKEAQGLFLTTNNRKQATQLLLDAGVPESAWPSAMAAPVPEANPLQGLNTDQAKAVKQATALVLYGNMDQARAALQNAGVPEGQWPAGLQPDRPQQ